MAETTLPRRRVPVPAQPWSEIWPGGLWQGGCLSDIPSGEFDYVLSSRPIGASSSAVLPGSTAPDSSSPGILIEAGFTAEDAIERVRAKRSADALENPYFVEWLQGEEVARG